MSAQSATLFRINFKEKLLAFAMHVGASFAIYLAFLLIVRLFWYPDFYYDVLNVQPILVTLFVVDIILGPLLTFVVYKKNKPRLKLDIGVIVAFQLAAFFYGGSVVYKERPLYLVYSIDRFVVVTANSIDTDFIVYPELKINLPQIVATDLPEDLVEKEAILFGVMQGGPDIEYLPYLYRPISNVKTQIKDKGILLTELPNEILNELAKERSHLICEKFKLFPMIPFKSRDQLLIWDIDEQKIAGLINEDPWHIIKSHKEI